MRCGIITTETSTTPSYTFSDSVAVVQLNGGRTWNPIVKSCECPSGKIRNGVFCSAESAVSCCDGSSQAASQCPTDYNGATAGCGTAPLCVDPIA